MKETILYRLFRIGAIPRKLLPLLQQEGIVVSDEGIGGWLITDNVKGPGKRYVNRSEGFSGCLVITRKRVICFTYWKRQINISVDDPAISELYFNIPDHSILSISFESSAFREKWEGVIELRFNTQKAQQFASFLKAIGARQGRRN